MGIGVGHHLVDKYNEYFKEQPEYIFDIGAHDLRDSLIMANRFPNSQVFAFECNPQMYQVCVNNCKVSNVHVYDYAISDKIGTIKFYVTHGNIGASSILQPMDFVPWTNNKSYQTIEVKTITIEEFCRIYNIPKIDLVWMDAQGAELYVLKGFGDYLKNVKMIQSEVGTKAYYKNHTLLPEIEEYLKTFNFKMIENSFDWSHENNVVFLNESFEKSK